MGSVDVHNDVFWVDRENEIHALRTRGSFPITEDSFWDPSPSDTELEVTWDKARLDAAEKTL